jgi:hypothetical protein
MMSAIRASGLGLVFTLAVVAAMIALCAVLLAPHLSYRLIRRAVRWRSSPDTLIEA